jgi:hypothetical protein
VDRYAAIHDVMLSVRPLSPNIDVTFFDTRKWAAFRMMCSVD